jgi:peptidoglycan/xylan/chitin deacetylase (PgdA/CDA1 family)
VFKKLVKSTVTRSLDFDLVPWRSMRSFKSGTIVLGYHGIARDEEIIDPWIQRSQTPLSEFKKHLEFISRKFDVISADQTIESGSQKQRIHLTFDDGYAGFADHAVPLLQEYGFTASVYVVTDALTENRSLPPYLGRAAIGNCEPGLITLDSIGFTGQISDRQSRSLAYSRASSVLKTGSPSATASLIEELTALISTDQWAEIHKKYATERLMQWDTLRAVSEAGFTIGGHTKSHISLSDSQSSSDIQDEVEGSIKAVRNEIGKCDWFAYPNGTTSDWSTVAADTVNQAGVKGAWTLEPGVIRNPNQHSPYRLPRYFVPRSFDRFRLLLNTALIRD